MIRSKIVYLAGAVLSAGWLLTATPATDAHARWGFSYYGPGVSVSVGRGWGYYGGWGYNRWGGYPYYHYGYRPYYPYYGSGIGISLGLGYNPGYYYAPPVYSGVIYQPYYVPVPTTTVIAPTYAPPVAQSEMVVPQATPPATIYTPPAPGPMRGERVVAASGSRQTARIEVTVPDANADVWFGDYRTTSRGTKRVFETPVLDGGRTYRYRINARWNEGNAARQEEMVAQVTPGGTAVVDFTRTARPGNGGERIPAPPIPQPPGDLPPE